MQPLCVPGSSDIVIYGVGRRHGLRAGDTAVCAIKRAGIGRGRIPVYVGVGILAAVSRHVVGRVFLWQLRVRR